jgi:hypothetical protein
MRCQFLKLKYHSLQSKSRRICDPQNFRQVAIQLDMDCAHTNPAFITPAVATGLRQRNRRRLRHGELSVSHRRRSGLQRRRMKASYKECTAAVKICKVSPMGTAVNPSSRPASSFVGQETPVRNQYHKAYASRIVAMALAGASAFAEPRKLTVGAVQDWDFVNGAWSDAGEGAIKPPSRQADYYCAFYKGASFSDVEATFKVRLDTNHCDAGFIVRAQNPSELPR